MTKKLAGKVALVTGGSRGIGAAIAMRFAADGADVAISYAASPDRAKQVAKQIESEGARAFAVKADQADPKQVIDLVKSVHAHLASWTFWLTTPVPTSLVSLVTPLLISRRSIASSPSM